MDRIADFEALEIDDDVIGDLGGIDDQLDVVTDDVQHATLLEAGRGVFILEAHRDSDGHGGMFRNAQEVGVQRTIGHGVEGHILGEGADGLAADFDHDDRIEEVTGAELLVEELFLDVDRQGFFVHTIDDGGYAALTAEGTGGSLACPIACLGRQRKLLAHCVSPKANLIQFSRHASRDDHRGKAAL